MERPERREIWLLGGPRHGERIDLGTGPRPVAEVVGQAVALRGYKRLLSVPAGDRLVEVFLAATARQAGGERRCRGRQEQLS